MSGLNKVMLIGHLGADPEKRSMRNGNDVVNMRVATSESWKDRDGNRQERTEWHTVVIFNENLGKIAYDHLRKGSKVYLEGHLHTRKWEKNGVDHYSTEIVLQQYRGAIVLLDRKDDNEGSSRGRGRREEPGQGDFYGDEPTRDVDRRREPPGPKPAAFDDDDLDADVPF